MIRLGCDEQFERFYIILVEASPTDLKVEAFEVGKPDKAVPMDRIIEDLLSRRLSEIQISMNTTLQKESEILLFRVSLERMVQHFIEFGQPSGSRLRHCHSSLRAG